MNSETNVAASAFNAFGLDAASLPETLGALVRECAAEHGDSLLGNWFDEGETLSYRDLDQQADRLASSLVRQGVRKGTHVAVMLPNVAAFPVTWVALGRIGAVMVPVNTAYTSEELHFVLTDSDAQFLIIDDTLLDAFYGMAEMPPLLTEARLIVRGEPGDRSVSWRQLLADGEFPFEPPSPISRTDLLNIQYTSGTTGFPKGCMLSHDYWVLIGCYAAEFRNRDGAVRNSLIWAPFYYMDPMWQFLMIMRLGGTAHIARRLSGSRFYDWLAEYDINYCIFPEPALKMRARSDEDKKLNLQYVSIYGWSREARQEVQERFQVTAREGYGMTEIGGATIVPSEAADKALEKTCGVPAPFRDLRIVDDNGNDVPDGETGELWVSGRSILWGYYKRPEANAVSFSGKWFRTGDIFRRDADGYYYIVGRIKDMIKRSGENIAAQEVEAALRALDAIEEAAVLPVPDPKRTEEVKACLKLKEGLGPDDCPPEAVIAHCEKRLAAFKVPRYIAYVDDFPRTPSRKIKKNVMIEEGGDLRIGAFDRVEGCWN